MKSLREDEREGAQWGRAPRPNPHTGGRAFRHVLAVVGNDPTVAHAAAGLARVGDARLSLVQTWSAPVALWGLGHPAVLPLGLSRVRAVAELAAAADERIRSIARELDHPGPLDFRCCRGRVSAVALRAARSGIYDAVVVRDGLLARYSRAARAFSSDLLADDRAYRVLSPRAEPRPRRLSFDRLARRA